MFLPTLALKTAFQRSVFAAAELETAEVIVIHRYNNILKVRVESRRQDVP